MDHFPQIQIMTAIALGLAASPYAVWGLAPAPPPGTPRVNATGIVVEEVATNSALAAAVLAAGDVLYSWERLAHPPANPEAAAGELSSPFDWLWLEVEQSQRGPVKLYGERDGQGAVFVVTPGEWTVHFNAERRKLTEVRPRLTGAMLKDYLAGWHLIAEGYVEKGEEIWVNSVRRNQPNNQSLESWLLYRIGRMWGNTGNWENASRSFQTATEGVVDAVSRTFILEAIARSYEYRNEFDQAHAFFLSVLHLRQKSWSESLYTARSHHQIGSMALHMGRLDEAAEHFSEALRIRQLHAPGTILEAEGLHAQAYLDGARFQLAAAERNVRKALEIQQRIEPDGLKAAFMLNTLGSILAQRRDLDGAEDYFKQALEIRKRLIPDSLPVATTMINIGRSLLVRELPDLAMEQLGPALVIVKRLDPNSLLLALNLNSIGRAAFLKGDLEASAEYHQMALKIQKKLAPGNLLVALSLASLGEVALHRNDLASAERYLMDALDIQKKIAPGSDTHSITLHHLGAIYYRLQRFGRAADFLNASIDVLENQITSLGGSQYVKGSYRARKQDLYRAAIKTQLALNHPEEAFYILERYRGQSFLAMLAERRLDPNATAPDELTESRRRVKARYDWILRKIAALSSTHSTEVLEELNREQRSLREYYDQLMDTARRTSRRGSAVQVPAPLSLGEVLQSLDRGTVMLSYSVGKEQTDLFVVTAAEGLKVFSLSIGESDLRQDVERFGCLIRSSQASFRLRQLEELGVRLYRTLMEPAAAQIEESERVLVIPDGPLHLLPFAALIREFQDKVDGKHKRGYVAEWKPLHIALSATVHDRLKRSRKQGNRPTPSQMRFQLAAFGDPVYPNHLTREDLMNVHEPVLRAIDRDLFDWTSLPFSRQEVEDISSLYPESDVRIYLGTEATEESVKSLGDDTRIIHFATHGYLDDRFPLDSALVLSIPVEFNADRENGLLQAWEVFEQIRLDADLVVLSACQSALGQEQGGEGLIGLTRAFQYAGARSVVASLWKVADRTTADLMVLFYQHLRAGEPKDEALRAAQIELIQGTPGSEASAPYYWAAFQLIGDWW